VRSYERLKEIIEGAGGFVYAGWCGSAACEERVKEETKATIRCLPDEEFRSRRRRSACLVCGGRGRARGGVGPGVLRKGRVLSASA
jgi:hypothetical protein